MSTQTFMGVDYEVCPDCGTDIDHCDCKEKSMQVTLTIEDIDTVVDHGSTVAITGTNEAGQRVTFAGDHRPMEDVLRALVTDEEDEISVDVEGWQILRTEA